MQTVLITGATGVLGRNLVEHIFKESQSQILALVRLRAGSRGTDRLPDILDSGSGTIERANRLRVLSGDLSQPGLGLASDLQETLRSEVNEFFHLAALTNLAASRDELFHANVGGTEHVLKLAWDLYQRGRLKRFCYFSTAFVAGSLQDWCAPEDTMCDHPAWSNAYEESKYVAEQRVRAAIADGLPATIFRPSIVVGETGTGETSKFNVVYPFFRLVSDGRLRKIPGRPTDTLPLVPVDFVSRAAWAISQMPESLGRAYHLVSKSPPNVNILLRIAREEFPKLPEVQLILPEGLDSAGSYVSILKAIKPNIGYLVHNLTFDTTNTERALLGTGVQMPDTGPEFVRRLFRYAKHAGYLA